MAKELAVCSLDVWGNEEDGFEVNQSYSTGVTVLADMSDDYYYRQIREHFNPRGAFKIEWQDESNADVSDKATGRPLYVIQEKY